MKQATELMYGEQDFSLTPDNSAAQIEYDMAQVGYEAAYVRCELTEELPF